MSADVAARREPLDREDREAADDQRDRDDLRVPEQRLDMLVQRETDHRRRDKRDHQVAQEQPGFRLTLQQPHADCPERPPVQHHDRQDRAELDDDVEHLPAPRVIAEQPRREDQMPGRGDGQEFGDPLDDAEEDDGEKFGQAGAPAR
jgi:hypothetical protein